MTRAWGIVLAVCAAGTAAASPRVPVILRIDACAEALGADTARIASVELARPVNVAPAPVADETALAIAVRCEDEELVVFAPGLSAAPKRVRLGDVDARVRARVLALAVAEFVEGLQQPALATVARTPPRTPPAGQLATAASPQPKRDLMVTAGVTTRAFAEATYAVGARASVHVALGTRLVCSVGALLESGRAERAPGVVEVSSYAGETVVGARFGSPRVGFLAGVGVVAGSVSARGRPDDPTQISAGRVTGAWLGPLARLRGHLGLGSRLTLGLALDGGVVPWTIHAGNDGRNERVWQGAWTTVAAEVGWSW